jgi:hypothetical protein
MPPHKPAGAGTVVVTGSRFDADPALAPIGATIIMPTKSAAPA